MVNVLDDRTSTGSPIRIAYLPFDALGLRGRIGVTFAPGKTDARWKRDLDTDLGRLRDLYRASHLVTLVEPHELKLLEIATLLEAAKARGLETLHVPIVDGSVPSMRVLVDLVSKILTFAAEGGNVVIHCRGGLGRAGTVAASCLVAVGHSPEEAMHVVRRIRPGAIENAAQEACVVAVAGAWRDERRSAPSHRPAEPSLAQVRGCLLGGALGDALGYPIEFDKPGAAILWRYGKEAPVDLCFAPNAKGLVSDDTQMTLFTAEGIIRAANRFTERGSCSLEGVLRNAYLRWYATQTGTASQECADPLGRGWLVAVQALHARRAPGNTCLSALGASKAGGAMFTVESPPNDSKGCGAIMRSAPFGLAASSREAAFDNGRDAGVLTHGHPSGYLSAAYFSALVFDIARGASLPAAMTLADELLDKERGNDEMRVILAKVRRAAADGPPSVEAIERLGGGWVGEEALAIALLCVLTTEAATPTGVAEVLWRSVAHGGDSDSTGSLVGNLLGVMHGVEVLPERWLAQLEMRDTIERVASDLHASSVLGVELDFESYPPS